MKQAPFNKLLLIILLPVFFAGKSINDQDKFIDYRVDLKKQNIKLYWKGDNNQPLRSIQHLKDFVEKKGQKLVFAMNGGMYKTDNSPLGLFINESKVITKLNTRSASGNFYLKPNGVFYIKSDNTAGIVTTPDFKLSSQIKYATQSGPMLVIDGKIHSGFTKGSSNINIRNGVGILPDGKVMFVLSKSFVNFYDFAEYFLKAGCKNALFLDGSISKAYLPAQNWTQTGGDFGVMIGETY